MSKMNGFKFKYTRYEPEKRFGFGGLLEMFGTATCGSATGCTTAATSRCSGRSCWPWRWLSFEKFHLLFGQQLRQVQNVQKSQLFGDPFRIDETETENELAKVQAARAIDVE